VAPQSKVELFAAIRRDSRVDGLGGRSPARKYEAPALVREAPRKQRHTLKRIFDRLVPEA